MILHFQLLLKGKLKITWRLRRLHFSDRILTEEYLVHDSIKTSTISLDFWKVVEDGMVSFDIEAIASSEIINFSYLTNRIPTNNVKLGIVIRIFNRQELRTSCC